jgi:predicted GNAT family acetyltransferase
MAQLLNRVNKNMQIQHEESDIRGRHFITDEANNMIAELTYAVNHPDTMVVDHTEVDERYQGQSLGKSLVDAVVDHARAKGRKLMAVCPYAKKVLDRRSDCADVYSIH